MQIPSDVWRFFEKVTENRKVVAGICRAQDGTRNVCGQQISAIGSNTSVMLRHLSSKHGITIESRKRHLSVWLFSILEIAIYQAKLIEALEDNVLPRRNVALASLYKVLQHCSFDVLKESSQQFK